MTAAVTTIWCRECGQTPLDRLDLVGEHATEYQCSLCSLRMADQVDMTVSREGAPRPDRADTPALCPVCDRWDSHSFTCPVGGLRASLSYLDKETITPVGTAQPSPEIAQGGHGKSATSVAPRRGLYHTGGRPRVHADRKAAVRVATKAYRARRKATVPA